MDSHQDAAGFPVQFDSSNRDYGHEAHNSQDSCHQPPDVLQLRSQTNSPLPSSPFHPSPSVHEVPSNDGQHAFALLSPDHFYKSYSVTGNHIHPDNHPMAPSSVTHPLPSSNSEVDPPPKAPTVITSRSIPRPSNLRTTNHLDPGLIASAGRTPGAKPSVKDLRRRFDHNLDAPAIPLVPPVPPVPTVGEVAKKDAVVLKSVRPGQQQSPTGMRSRNAKGSSPSKSPRSSSMRPKYVAENQVSNNPQSFASRVGKPKMPASGKSNLPLSLTHQTMSSPQLVPMSSPPGDLSNSALLFGEVLPDHFNTTMTIGFGIDAFRPSGTTQSETRGQWTHQRSLSDADIDPSSDNYRYRPTNTQDNGQQLLSSPVSRARVRSFSDVASQRPHKPITRKPVPQNLSSSQSNPSSSTSRLPVSVRGVSSPVNSSSPSSTRSSSPSIRKRPLPTSRGSRASTPTTSTKVTTSKVKTPTPTAERKTVSTALPTANTHNRLQAFIGATPPKLSPPLRSSRPRQPVSMATTASSRLKAVDRSGRLGNASPTSSTHHGRQTDHAATRRRKISIGPIDFEQRREHIRLAYTKSVRETQVQEARDKASEKRRVQLAAAGEEKAADETVTTINSRYRSGKGASSSSKSVNENAVEKETENKVVPISFVEPITTVVTRSLTPEASANSIQPVLNATVNDLNPPMESTVRKFDLPTLKLEKPVGNSGATTQPYPAPLSAISATSETTEFDIDPSPFTPTEAESPIEIPITIVRSLSPRPSPRPHYQYPLEEVSDSLGRQGSLEPTQETHTGDVKASGTQPTMTDALDDQSDTVNSAISPSFSGYETIVTILPPRDASNEMASMDSPTIPFPNMDLAMDDESDCHTEFEDPRAPDMTGEQSQVNEYRHQEEEVDEGETTDACTECTDENERTDDCQSQSRYGDQLSSRRASSCESSESGGRNQIHYAVYQNSPAKNPMATLVPSSIRAERSSLQSVWTEVTINSPERANDLESKAQGNATPIYSHLQSLRINSGADRDELSLRGSQDEPNQLRPSSDSIGSSFSMGRHQLPDIEIGDGFTIPYLSKEHCPSIPNVPLPDHDPPPIPTPTSSSAMNSQRVSRVFYDQSQSGSTANHSEGGSDEFVSQLETPQTIDTTSTGGTDHYFGLPSQASDLRFLAPDGEELSEKERHRLIQRRNVIKELVDTEAVFVRDMNIVEEIYKGTAEACPKLDAQTVKQIFRNTNEIIEFHTTFLAQVKEAVASVYKPKGGQLSVSTSTDQNTDEAGHAQPTVVNDAKDRATTIGPVFQNSAEQIKTVHEAFLRSSDQAAKKLIHIQQDPGVKVWLTECNEVAKDLTAAWDLDSLLIKPMQRITKYPNLIVTLLQHTPQDHPDREALTSAKETLEASIVEINKTKKNFELVGQIVGRKRKESDVKTGIVRAFGKRVDKATGSRVPEDLEYAKLNERFGDDYLRLQVVLRDVEFYTRQVATYVREFLNYISSIELIMRLTPGSYPELESKWVQFNISIRDLEKVTLEEHLSQVRSQVIEPFEQVIKAYGNPSLAMKKRQKRRLDFERMEQLKRAGKSADTKLQEQVEQYEALNDTLKKELPKLSELTEKIGNICLGNLVNIQTSWFRIWKDKMKTILVDCHDVPDLEEVVLIFERDFPYPDAQVASIGILQPAPTRRPSQSTGASGDDISSRIRSPRPSDIDIARSRNMSLNGESAPSLPTPDFMKRTGGFESMSPNPNVPKGAASPHQYYYRDYYANANSSTPASASAQPSSSASALTLEKTGSTRSLASRSFAETGATSTRPSTGRSFESGPIPRQSTDSQHRRDSYATFSSNHGPYDNRRFSGLFHSALPMPDGPEESYRSSRASSRERAPANDGYNILWLAASLFEFNIATTKHEAGYPYLIYQAGEIFDVIAEKGELWLAKNQDDQSAQVGWIWSKHFAKLAES